MLRVIRPAISSVVPVKQTCWKYCEGADDFVFWHGCGVPIEQTCNYVRRSVAIYEHHHLSGVAADLQAHHAAWNAVMAQNCDARLLLFGAPSFHFRGNNATWNRVLTVKFVRLGAALCISLKVVWSDRGCSDAAFAMGASSTSA